MWAIALTCLSIGTGCSLTTSTEGLTSQNAPAQADKPAGSAKPPAPPPASSASATTPASGADADLDTATASSGAMCGYTLGENSYDGPQFWGTLSFQNDGVAAMTDFSVEFDIPSGAHCTSDHVPSGATLSPLNGAKTETLSNHCKYTWSATALDPGNWKRFHYSTDSDAFDSAFNVLVDPTCAN
jgi:chitosanase